MECHIYTTPHTTPQYMERDWYGTTITPPVSFLFELTSHELIFTAARPAPATINPAARPGTFCPELWKYDTAEFFLANPQTGHYLEFNLCPNGAWWSQTFSTARIPSTDPPPSGITTQAQHTPSGWHTRATIPLTELSRLGLNPHHCLLAAAAIINTPNYLFLTTAEQQTGEPDFHRPTHWPPARLI